VKPNIRVKSVEVLSDDWAMLKKTTLDYQRRDGTWETQIARLTIAATVPPSFHSIRSARRQFRYVAYVTGHEEALIEACAGLLDADDPETCIRKEAEEELAIGCGMCIGFIRLI
jgi:hypothetical protein